MLYFKMGSLLEFTFAHVKWTSDPVYRPRRTGSVANRKSYRKNDFDFDKTTEKTNFDPGNLTSPRKLRGGGNAL